MPFHAYEQPAGQPRRYITTLPTPLDAAQWLVAHSEKFEDPDLYARNPTVRAHFAAQKLSGGEAVTWTLNSRPISLTVEPDGNRPPVPPQP